MRLAGVALVLFVACQPPPAQSPCPPQTVYVAAPVASAGGGDPTPTPAPDPLPVYQPPPSGTQAEIAARLDVEGTQLFGAKRYGEASSKFREAVARVPEAKYFVHLCESLFYDGRFAEAMTACDAVGKTYPTPDLQRSADLLIRRIQSEARAQGITVAPPDPRPAPPPGYQPAPNGTQADLAAKLDVEGTRLAGSKRYAEASAKFREAVARVPEAKYFLHLCDSLFYEGKFGEALTACDAVGKNYPTPDIRQKADVLTQRIKSEARAQGLDLSRP